MSDGFFSKIILIIIYLAIIVMIPLFLDYLFVITVRKRRKTQIKYLAEQKAIKTNKSLIIFNDRYHGIVSHISDPDNKKEEFTGDINEIIYQMADNSCVIVISEILEYVNDPKTLIEQLKKVSGGDLYIVNIEKNSPRIWWDYNIKNIMNKSYYLPDNNEIKWNQPNNLQMKIQKFYSYVFKIIPYNFFINNPIEKI